MAWASPYINGSYLYSADGLGDGVPTIIAPDEVAVEGVTRIRGEEACAKFLQRTRAMVRTRAILDCLIQFHPLICFFLV